MFRAPLTLGVVICCTLAARTASAEQPNGKQPKESNRMSKTMGGAQFWCDELFFHHWRIQQNVLTGHYRLLDEGNVRHAWGAYSHCVDNLEEIRKQQSLKPMQGKAVILMHGLGRTRKSMQKMAHFFEQSGYVVFNVSYPSTRGSHDDHAAALARIIKGLNGIDTINFVGHSMGNIVVRRYLEKYAGQQGQLPDLRIARFVMLAPPNQGAAQAERLLALDVSGKLAGQAARELGPEWDKFRQKLGTPACEFGIVAGDSGGRGNPLIEGADDLVIPVATTRLAGASDFRVVPNVHTFLMDDAEVQEMSLKFVKHGYFETDADRQPIE